MVGGNLLELLLVIVLFEELNSSSRIGDLNVVLMFNWWLKFIFDSRKPNGVFNFRKILFVYQRKEPTDY